MKVLFLEIDTEKSWAMAAMGPALLAPHLKKQGHKPAFFRVTTQMVLAEVLAKIRSRNPGLLALSLTNRQWLRAKTITNAVKKKLDLPTVAGGLMPTFCSGQVLAQPGFDYACIGEGEQALADLADSLSQNKTPAFGEIDNIRLKNSPFPRLRPLLDLSNPLLAPDRRFLDEPPGVVHVNAARGCPFSCTYCGARSIQNLYKNAPVRRRRAEEVTAELKQIAQNRPLNYVIFLDDTFTANPDWVRRFCDLYQQEVGAGFTIHARPDTVSDRMLDQLARSGCKHVVFGVESGSARVRRDIMNRPMSNETIEAAFSRAREKGILVTANYMLGLPGETGPDVEQTLDLHRRLDPDDFGFFVYYPYPGTPLFDLCREKGYLPENYLDLPVAHNASILRLPALSDLIF